MPTLRQQIASIEAALEKATKGEWVARCGVGQYANEVVGKTVRGKDVVIARVSGGPNFRLPNAQSIALTHNHAPALIAAVKVLSSSLAGVLSAWDAIDENTLVPEELNSGVMEEARAALAQLDKEQG